MKLVLIRNRRAVMQAVLERFDDPFFDHEAESDARAYRDLANPDAFFPLLEGGVHGSPELQRKYGDKV